MKNFKYLGKYLKNALFGVGLGLMVYCGNPDNDNEYKPTPPTPSCEEGSKKCDGNIVMRCENNDWVEDLNCDNFDGYAVDICGGDNILYHKYKDYFCETSEFESYCAYEESLVPTNCTCEKDDEGYIEIYCPDDE